MAIQSFDILSLSWGTPQSKSRSVGLSTNAEECGSPGPGGARAPRPALASPPAHGFGPDYALTPRESEALDQAVAGLPYARIAQCMGIGLRTVKLLLANAYGKIGVRSRAEAVSMSIRLRRSEAQANGDWLAWFNEHTQSPWHLGEGSILFRRGEAGDGLYLVERGVIALEGTGRFIADGAILGEIGVFTPAHQRTSTAVCASAVDLRFLSAQEALKLYYSQPAFALRMLELIAGRLMADLTVEDSSSDVLAGKANGAGQDAT